MGCCYWWQGWTSIKTWKSWATFSSFKTMPAKMTTTLLWLVLPSSSNQEFADASVRSNEQKGLLIAGVPYHLSPIPLIFPFLPIPYPFWCLLRRLCSLVKFVWHVLHNSTTAFCAWVKALMNDSAQSWPKPEISSWPSLFKHKGGIFSLSSQECFDAAKTIH